MRTADFHYDLPPERIAQEALEPRDAARLLDCRDLSDHTVADLPQLLEEGDLLVVNRTRVRRARLVGARADTGGRIELLLLEKAGRSWSALARPSRRLRPGVEIVAGPLTLVVTAGPVEGVVELEVTAGGDDVEGAIEESGHVPLPPYFTGRLDDPDRYQTMFADVTASAAAPTAGLHFTEDVVRGLEERGVAIARVHLQVSIDTFRPIATDTIDDHAMHSENFDVGPDAAAAVAGTRRSGGRVIAVGTTVVRALESAADPDGAIAPYAGATDLFITPGYPFRVVDGLITNFHVPGSTLVVMVAAFMGDRWRAAYAAAIDRGYRMLSFGDAMMAFR